MQRSWGRLLASVPLALLAACAAEAEPPRFDEAGGSHTYDNGITLVVPAGALETETQISIRDLSEDEMNLLLQVRNISKDRVLFAFSAEPDGLAFNEPVELTVPTPGLTPELIPLITELHAEERIATVADVSYATHLTDETLTLSMSHFSEYAAEIVEELKKKECTDPSNTTCRCFDVDVSQSDYDASCSRADCQVLYSENRVKFTACEGEPEESSIFEETSEGCVPAFELTPGREYLDFGEQTELRAQILLGCATRFPDREVTFFATGPAILNPDASDTNEDGWAATTLTAGDEEGVVVLAAETTLTYFIKRINVNGVDLTKEEKTEQLVDTENVYVLDKPVIDVSALDDIIDTDSGTIILATVTRGGRPMPGQLVRFSVSGPATIAPPLGTTDDSGLTGTDLSSGDVEGIAVVTGECDARVQLAGGEEAVIPVSDIADVFIGKEPDYDGSVWRFVYAEENLGEVDPQGCEDVYVKSECSCVGDYEGVTFEDRVYQEITGEFTVVREPSYSYRIDFGSVSGLLEVSRPAFQYYLTCPLGGGLGVPGCACQDPSDTRTDGHGEDALEDSRTFTWSDPSEDQMSGDAVSDGTLWIDFNPPSDEDAIEHRSWNSTVSTCECLGWDGTRNYSAHSVGSFTGWRWRDISLRDAQWTDHHESPGYRSHRSYSIQCVAHCSF